MMWTGEKREPKHETQIERLTREAEELDRQVEHMRGCSWLGDEPPWARLQRDATDKRLLAAMLAAAGAP